jgi:predicted ArsR family transcriptional regulator
MVRATGAQTQGAFGLDHAQLLALCERPVSVAEVAARMQVPAAVVKVLLSDLTEGGAVVAGDTHPASPGHYARPDRDLLEAVRDGLLKRL